MPKNLFKLGVNKPTLIAVSFGLCFLLLFLSAVMSHQDDFVLGLFFGLLIGMGVINFFIYLYTQSHRFLIYSLLIFCWELALATFYGLDEQVIWLNHEWLKQYSLSIFVNLSLCISLLFSYFLFALKQHSKFISYAFKGLISATLLNFILGFVLKHELMVISLVILLSVTTLVIFLGAGWLWVKGVFSAQNYTFAWGAFLICAGLFGFQQYNLLAIHDSILLFGAVIKVSCLTLTMILGYHQQKQNQLTEQMQSLENENQVYQADIKKLQAQDSATESLEYSMQERTLELEVALRELSEKNRELEEKNTLDALTGIRNRSYFDKKYQAEVRRSRREQTRLVVVMLDIDHFKKVNDNYGHLVGDECIKAVAHRLQESLKRPSDDACRFGGEEFALILPSTELDGALAFVEQIRADIASTPIKVDDIEVNITISAGIGSAIADLSQSEDFILALADQQLYKAKNAGRNKVLASNIFEQVVQEQ